MTVSFLATTTTVALSYSLLTNLIFTLTLAGILAFTAADVAILLLNRSQMLLHFLISGLKRRGDERECSFHLWGLQMQTP
jgi:hypothetical protein